MLYELVCGRPAFDGASPVDTLHSILHRQPPFPEHLPRELTRILRKCLARDRDERYHSIKDVAIDLRELAREMRSAPLAQAKATRPGKWIMAAAALLMLVAVVAIRLTMFADAPAAPSSVKMARLTFSGNVWSTALAPDGNYVVYSVRDRDGDELWVKQIATGSLFRLAQNKMGYFGGIRISPDGNYVYFQAMERRDPNIIDLYQIPLLGGDRRKVLSNIDGSFCVSPDGSSIAFVRFNAAERQPRLLVVDLATGEERLLLKRPDGFIGASSWAPDGKSIAFVSFPQRKDGKRLIEQVRLSDGSTSEVIPNTFGRVFGAQWLTDGAGLVARQRIREPPQLWFAPYRRKARRSPMRWSPDEEERSRRRTARSWHWDVENRRTSWDRCDNPLAGTTDHHGLANLYGGRRSERKRRRIISAWEGAPICELPAPAERGGRPAWATSPEGAAMKTIAVSPTVRRVRMSVITRTAGVWISNFDDRSASS